MDLTPLQKAKKLRKGQKGNAFGHILSFEESNSGEKQFFDSDMDHSGMVHFNRLTWLQVRRSLKNGFWWFY